MLKTLKFSTKSWEYGGLIKVEKQKTLYIYKYEKNGKNK